MLTSKQSAFLEAYKVLNNPVKSAISAGYAAKSAHVEASRLMKNVKILSELNEWRKQKNLAISKADFVDMALDDYRSLETTEPNKPRFLDIAGKALGYLGVNNEGKQASQTLNVLNINMSGQEKQGDLWDMTRKLLQND